MKSRPYLIFFLFIWTILPGLCLGQNEFDVYNYWKYYEGEPSKALYKQMAQLAFGQLEQRRKDMKDLKTPAQWKQRQETLQSKLALSVGSFPEKTPLNPVITGSFEKNGYRVEKLYFESRPRYYVTAALFIPQQRATPAPAIIYCSGHTTEGFRSETYQQIILNYVKKGFIVLAFDPIGQGERSQYPGTDLQKSAVKEHSYPGSQSFLSGRPPANYFIWDGIRTVDYLLTRKEVDPARIGITGRSGGGTQSAYIAALDHRILAAAPECYITSFDKLLRSNGPQDAEQNLLHGLENGLDMADFLIVRAPKPALIVATTNDMFAIQGARDAHAEALNAYRAWGFPQNMQLTEDDAGHASTLKNREASYAFFQKALNNPGDSTDEKVQYLSPLELQVTTTGQVVTDLKSETIFSINKEFSQRLIAGRPNAQSATELVEKIIKITGYRPSTVTPETIFSGRAVKKGFTIDRYLIKGTGDHYLPILWLLPNKISLEPVMLLDDRGKAVALSEEGFAHSLLRAGHPVLLPDLSGFGELSTGYIRGGDSVIEGVPLNLWHLGILTHQYPIAIRMEEIGLLSRFIQNKLPLQKKLIGISRGTLGTDLLHASLFQQGFTKLVMIDPLISFESITLAKDYQTKYIPSSIPGVLAYYDLPDLFNAIPELKPILINPRHANGKEWVDQEQSEMRNSYMTIRNGVNEQDYGRHLRD
ncbi:alpha/beta hydrolase family protein [Dyadobacter tibetensis]|uniref:alpha/beta hydrolase family protein n=1 Tax=Dyadobacter tibetensis TaxID=1211851 RepID=UPI00046E7452|nr:acetylxylan esterase [Dyadobacter tibetensis]